MDEKFSFISVIYNEKALDTNHFLPFLHMRNNMARSLNMFMACAKK